MRHIFHAELTSAGLAHSPIVKHVALLPVFQRRVSVRTHPFRDDFVHLPELMRARGRGSVNIDDLSWLFSSGGLPPLR